MEVATERLEARIALGDLPARLPDFALASSAPWAPRQAFPVHGPTHLPLRFTAGRVLLAG